MCVVWMTPAGRTIDADRNRCRVGTFAAFAPQSAGNGPNIADFSGRKGAVADCNPNIAIAPKPCGTMQIASDCNGDVADCQPNMAKFRPGIAYGMCHLPFGNWQVLCVASAHTGRGGVQHTCCDKAQHHSRKFYHPTPLSQIVILGALGSNCLSHRRCLRA